MNPVEQAEQIARSKARNSGKEFDSLPEAEKERLLKLALDDVTKRKPSDDG